MDLFRTERPPRPLAVLENFEFQKYAPFLFVNAKYRLAIVKIL